MLLKQPVLVGGLALFVLSLSLVGCPAGPALLVSPGALDFFTTAENLSFTLFNEGSGELLWNVSEVVWMGAVAGWVEQDVPWLTIDPADRSGTVTDGTHRVFLSGDRTGLAMGTYTGAGVRITSNGGITTVPVSISVSGSGDPGPGEGDLVVEPSAVTLNGLDDLATLTVRNGGDALIYWYAQVTVDDPEAPVDAPVQIGVNPIEAVTAAGAETTMQAGALDPATFDIEVLQYLISFRDRTTNAVLAEVSVTMDLIGLPAIAIDPTLLNYGTEGYQKSFRVANTGDVNSLLDFAVFTKTDDIYTYFNIESDPLIEAISAVGGTEDVPVGDPEEPFLLSREVAVTIARDGIESDLEYREFWIGAVAGTDAAGNPVLDPDVEPASLKIRVDAASAVEGAINRSRPPSLMRFVFLLRDKQGQAVNAADELVRNQINFFVQEDDFAIDPDESSQFVTGPENLRYNIALLLDYTGSMYNAGVDDPLNPLQPGEAIEQMVEAAKQFVLDLPGTYRIALLEYHGRQQPSRLIHSFDTDKTRLVTALDAFTLPAPEHGASELYDALIDSINIIAGEDPPTTLPFDEADVRAVVFLSDGWDTSSIEDKAQVIKTAEEQRVRLYPVGYSGRLTNPVNGALLIELSTETGGHAYNAPEIDGLTTLLDTEGALTFSRTEIDTAAGTATLKIRNNQDGVVTWRATESLAWLTVSPASGAVPAQQRDETGLVIEPGVRDVNLSLSPGLAAGDYEGSFSIVSVDGDATVTVQATVGAGGAVSALTVTPQTLEAGQLWRELSGQLVLTYTSLFQAGAHTYKIEATFPDSNGNATSAMFEEDGVFFPGDERAGQISLTTNGVQGGAAKVVVRTDYVPRNITQFRFRFILNVPESLTPDLTPAERTALLAELRAQMDAGAVRLASGGLLDTWRLIDEGNGVFTLVTEPDDYLQFGAFGNLLEADFDGLGANDAFTVGFRVDNTLYYSPASESSPSLTKYFLYPGGITNPGAILNAGQGSDTAGPAQTLADFVLPIDPEAAGAWDRDDDSWDDFDDSDPDDDEVGDRDGDNVPDLDDPAPLNPAIP